MSKKSLFIVRFLTCFLICAVASFFACNASAQNIMPLKDIKPGDNGYGLTVFEGMKSEKFDYVVYQQ